MPSHTLLSHTLSCPPMPSHILHSPIPHLPYSPTPPPLHLRCSQSSCFRVCTGTMDLLTRVNNEADSLISTLNSWRCRLPRTRLIKELAWEVWRSTVGFWAEFPTSLRYPSSSQKEVLAFWVLMAETERWGGLLGTSAQSAIPEVKMADQSPLVKSTTAARWVRASDPHVDYCPGIDSALTVQKTRSLSTGW